MSPDDEDAQAAPGASAGKVVVCGVCERMLDGRWDDQEPAERAADAHERREHADREHVVVLPVDRALVEAEGEEGVVEIAAGAQERLDAGEAGEGLLG